MKKLNPTIKLCELALVIIEAAKQQPVAPFKVEGIYRAAEGNRMVDFIAEVTGTDGRLSWITIEPTEAAETNERMNGAVCSLRDSRAPAPTEQPWMYLLSAVIVAIQTTVDK